MKILAIETSCDDTSMALVEVLSSEPCLPAGRRSRGVTLPVFKVLKNIVSSQTAIHRHWGGVVPNLAKREHLKNLPLVWKELSPTLILPLRKEGGNKSFVDLIAVTVGPGLEPSLWTGIEFAKKLSAELNVPLVGANHLEGHLYSNLLSLSHSERSEESRDSSRRACLSGRQAQNDSGQTIRFPAIVLLVSGGHTMLVLMKSLKTWQKLGETRDDAVGEAFDKVAKMTGLPYPGGPEIEKLAALGNPEAIKFPRPMIHPVRSSPPHRPLRGATSNGVAAHNYDFSFSGLKTAVLYYLKGKSPTLILPLSQEGGNGKDLPPSGAVGGGVGGGSSNLSLRGLAKQSLADISASFQAAAIDVLVTKTFRAVKEFGAKSVFLCGGVAANKALRAALQSEADKAGVQFFAPSAEYNTDNAAMIAAAAYMRAASRKKKYPIEAGSNLTL